MKLKFKIDLSSSNLAQYLFLEKFWLTKIVKLQLLYDLKTIEIPRACQIVLNCVVCVLGPAKTAILMPRKRPFSLLVCLKMCFRVLSKNDVTYMNQIFSTGQNKLILIEYCFFSVCFIFNKSKYSLLYHAIQNLDFCNNPWLIFRTFKN